MVCFGEGIHSVNEASIVTFGNSKYNAEVHLHGCKSGCSGCGNHVD